MNAIEFETNQATRKEESYEELEAVAQLLIRKEAKVHIVGHTDAVGKAEKNLQLSITRALSVKAFLQEQGVATGQITTSGKGETEPIVTNDTPQGRAKNRRVEIKILETK